MAEKNKKDVNNLEEEKFMTSYDKKMMKRNEEAAKRKKRKSTVRGLAVTVCAVVLIIVGFFAYSSISEGMCYLKVDEQNISKDEFNFYYTRMEEQCYSTYAVYGLDTSAPLEAQQYAEGVTWKDYAEQMATEELVRIKALVKDAKANDFKGDIEEDFDTYEKSMAKSAKEAGVSEDAYYEDTFGLDKSDAEDYIKEYLLATAWESEINDKNNPTDDEIEKFYNENKNNYDLVSYYVTTVTAEGASADNSDAAMATAKAEAQKKLDSVEKDGEFVEYGFINSMTTKLGEWLFDEARKAGDAAVVEETDTTVCYAVKFVNRRKGTDITRDIRSIITSDEKFDEEAVLKEWQNGEKTEESFIKLVKEYTEETSAKDGLYEGVSKAGMLAGSEADMKELVQWIFASGRKEGDATSCELSDGTKYVVYYKGENEEDYKYNIREALKSEKTLEWENGLVDSIKVENPNKLAGVDKFLEAGKAESK